MRSCKSSKSKSRMMHQEVTPLQCKIEVRAFSQQHSSLPVERSGCATKLLILTGCKLKRPKRPRAKIFLCHSYGLHDFHQNHHRRPWHNRTIPAEFACFNHFHPREAEVVSLAWHSQHEPLRKSPSMQHARLTQAPCRHYDRTLPTADGSGSIGP